MNKTGITGRIVHGLLKAVARLPLGVLYVFSDIAAPVLRLVARYRLNVVRENLDKCFPDLSPRQRRAIEKDFYRNFADYIVETVKLLHISDAEMSRRMTFSGTEHITGALEAGKDVLIYFSHCINWEWAPSVTLHMPPETSGRKIVYGQVYRPLRDAFSDALMLKLRGRFGSESFPKSHVLRDLITIRRENKASVTGFMSDQKPSHGDPTYPAIFLGRPTAFISGTETLARKMDMAVIYWDMEKTRRGHYHIACRPVALSAAAENPGAITGRYVRLLETTIRRRPGIWLWTHKRWKNQPTTL